MRSVFAMGLLAMGLLVGAALDPAMAATCSDRKQVCLAYCAKTYDNAPRCLDACGNLLGVCLSTGCWESKVAAKQCGFARQ